MWRSTRRRSRSCWGGSLRGTSPLCAPRCMGLDDDDIARLLDIPVESVPNTLGVAAAKLTTLLADRPRP